MIKYTHLSWRISVPDSDPGRPCTFLSVNESTNSGLKKAPGQTRGDIGEVAYFHIFLITSVILKTILESEEHLDVILGIPDIIFLYHKIVLLSGESLKGCYYYKEDDKLV